MTRVLALAILGITLITASPSLAEEKMGSKASMMRQETKEMHYDDVRELALMMKEVMVILRDLNHYPSDQQKKRLGEMISKTDEISKMSSGY